MWRKLVSWPIFLQVVATLSSYQKAPSCLPVAMRPKANLALTYPMVKIVFSHLQKWPASQLIQSTKFSAEHIILLCLTTKEKFGVLEPIITRRSQAQDLPNKSLSRLTYQTELSRFLLAVEVLLYWSQAYATFGEWALRIQRASKTKDSSL